MATLTLEKISIQRAMNGFAGVVLIGDPWTWDYTVTPNLVNTVPVEVVMGELLYFDVDLIADVLIDDHFAYFYFNIADIATNWKSNSNVVFPDQIIAIRFKIGRMDVGDILSYDTISDFTGSSGIDDNTLANSGLNNITRIPTDKWRIECTERSTIHKFKLQFVHLVGRFKSQMPGKTDYADNINYLLKSNASDSESVMVPIDYSIDEAYKQIINAAPSVYKDPGKCYMFLGYGLKTITGSNLPDTVIKDWTWLLSNSQGKKIECRGLFYNLKTISTAIPINLQQGSHGILDSDPILELSLNNQPVSYLSLDSNTLIKFKFSYTFQTVVAAYLINISNNDLGKDAYNNYRINDGSVLIVFNNTPGDIAQLGQGWLWDNNDTTKILIAPSILSVESGYLVGSFYVDHSALNLADLYKFVFVCYEDDYIQYTGQPTLKATSFISQSFQALENKCTISSSVSNATPINCNNPSASIDISFVVSGPPDSSCLTSLLSTLTLEIRDSNDVVINTIVGLTNTVTISGLSAGQYTYIYFFDDGDPDTYNEIYGTGSFEIIDETIVIDVIQTSASCEDVNGGSFTILATSDATNQSYTYVLKVVGPENITQPIDINEETTIDQLVPGIYNVTVTNNDTGCFTTITVQVDIISFIVQTTASSCGCNGTALLVSEVPLTSEVKIEWSIPHKIIYQDNYNQLTSEQLLIEDLCNGNYNVKVSLVNNPFCSQTINFEINGTSSSYIPIKEWQLDDQKIPFIPNPCGCGKPKTYITTYEDIIHRYIKEVNSKMLSSFEKAYGANVFGDVDCSNENYSNVNDYLYLGIYLFLIRIRKDRDYVLSKNNKSYSNSVYWNIYKLDCVLNYFSCNGININPLISIFGLSKEQTEAKVYIDESIKIKNKHY